MNKLFFAALAAFLPRVFFAQSIDRQVIGSAGLVGNTANIEMLATVGEAVTATFSTGSFEITQGFHQPDLVESATVAPKILVNFSVFPNPLSADELTVEISPEKDIQLGLQLFSADGKLVRELEKSGLFFTGKNHKSFIINDLAAGNYFLAATDAAGRVVKTMSVFKI